jgi:uncharacterized protein YcbK (DUF882 family)
MALDLLYGSDSSKPTRRRVLAGIAGLVAGSVAMSSRGLAAPLTLAGVEAGPEAAEEVASHSASDRRIALRSLNTGERVDVTYWQGGQYVPEALAQLDSFMRDWRNDEVGRMDPKLFDMLWAIGLAIGEDPEFTVLCGFRSQATSAMLRARGSGVARDSMHLHGRAADITMPGASLQTLCDTAKALHCGGVGYYPRSNFVHVDTGEFRTW